MNTKLQLNRQLNSYVRILEKAKKMKSNYNRNLFLREFHAELGFCFYAKEFKNNVLDEFEKYFLKDDGYITHPFLSVKIERYEALLRLRIYIFKQIIKKYNNL